MEPTDVKKLKVSELRAKLQERGLDTKGLKGELVGRLLAAVEAECQTTTTTTTNSESDNSEYATSDRNNVPVDATLTGVPLGNCKVLVERIPEMDNYNVAKSDSITDTVHGSDTINDPISQHKTEQLCSEPTFKDVKIKQLGDEACPDILREEYVKTKTLTEVKKLRVGELRARLQERGLDTKGQKSELLDRLMSAIEREFQLKGSVNIEENARFDGDVSKHDDQFAASTGVLFNGGSCHVLIERSSELDAHSVTKSSTSCTDSSTQTDDSVAQHGTAKCCSDAVKYDHISHGDRLQMHKDVGSADNMETQPVQSKSLPVRCSHESLATAHPVELSSKCLERNTMSNWSETQKVELECRNLLQPESRGPKRFQTERGRDYYEFKEEIHYNRVKSPVLAIEEEAMTDAHMVRLDSYNSDLHFEVSPDGSSGRPLLWEKFPLLWSGCRLTHGVRRGKAGFEAKFVRKLSAPGPQTGFDPDPHVLRVGWSADATSLQLGEVEMSYGFDGRGRKVSEGKEEEFGEPFSEGDVIGCYADMSSDRSVELSFCKNGRSLGVAFRLSASILGLHALYPHVLCKNCSVSINLDATGQTWYPGPNEYRPLPALAPEDRIRAPLPPTSKGDCEVLMMVGMTGAGKTHWAKVHTSQNPDKRYNLLSTDSILHCMREGSGPEHADLRLKHATQCVGELIKVASGKRRNYILDQVNIYPSAQKHKMQLFRGFVRTAVVVVPSDEEWRRRLAQRHLDEGVQVPEMSLHKVKVSFTLPEPGDLLEEVHFVELPHEEVQNLLMTYKEEARPLLPPAPKRKKLRNHRNKTLNCRHNAWGATYGWNQGHLNQQTCNYQSAWGPQDRHVWPDPSLSAFNPSYGYNSDPHRYREYYRPYTGRWTTYYEDQGYYGKLIHSNIQD